MSFFERSKPLVLPFVAGAGTATYLLFGQPQDLFSVAVSLAPVAAAIAFFTPGGAWFALPIALNGLTCVAISGAIRSCWLRRRWLSVVLVGLLTMWVYSAFAAHASTYRLRSYTEVVLTPGMKLTARTPNGTLTILAGNGTRRTYHGDGWAKSILLQSRPGRWYGSLGLYDPAESFSPYGRLLPEEGRQHFSTQAEAEGWLRARSREAGVGKERLVFTSNGLVLRYSLDPVPGTGVPTASVDLWQIYVGGRRPRGLPGGEDDAIRVEGGTIAETSTPHSM